MTSLFLDDFGTLQWDAIAIVLFAIAFFIVGIYRTVEFSSIGLRSTQKKVYLSLHVIGCLLFSAAMILGAINLHEDRRTLMFSTFIAAMIFLAPGQFKIGMVRRKIERENFERLNSKK